MSEKNNKKVNTNEMTVSEMNNYILSDLKVSDIDKKYKVFSLKELEKNSSIALPITTILNDIAKNGNSNQLYKVTNMKLGEKLYTTKKGVTYGSLVQRGGKRTMAKFTAVGSMPVVDPTTLMVAIALASIKKELNEIEKIGKDILKFLEEERESEIEADLKTLQKIMQELPFNINDEKFLTSNYKLVLDIRRTAEKHINSYEKEIERELEKKKIIVVKIGLDSIYRDIEKLFKYYRLNIYIYSYCSFMEIMFLENYKEEFLDNKKNDVNEKIKKYTEKYDKALKYISENLSKSLEKNVLTVGGNVAKWGSDVLSKNINKGELVNRLGEHGKDFIKKSKKIEKNYKDSFKKYKDSYSKRFVDQIELINESMNKVEEVYFDVKNVYVKIPKQVAVAASRN